MTVCLCDYSIIIAIASSVLHYYTGLYDCNRTLVTFLFPPLNVIMLTGS